MTAAEFIQACQECNTVEKAAELLRNACTLAVKYNEQAEIIQQYSEQVARLTEQVEELTAELEEKRIELAELGSLNALIGRLGAVTIQNEESAEKLTAAVEQVDKLSAEKLQPDKPEPKPKKQVSKKTDSKEPRAKYGEYKHVLLTGAQYARLVKEFGAKTTDEYIRKVDEYCELNGKSYKNYNLAIQKFMREDNIKKEAEKAESSDSGIHSYDLDKLLDHAKKNIPKLDGSDNNEGEKGT
ncbi:MAG: hypothetical protein ACI4JK_02200 [Oscillospiraceae bacterium]